jgi:ubiquinone/menaquinone biosynthesis C-methylase UbiE
MKRWTLASLVVIAGAIAVAAAGLPYIPFLHGTTEDEVQRLVAWLDIAPGTRIADFGAGDGAYAIALALRVGPSGHVYANEINPQRLTEIRSAAADAGLDNVSAIEGAVAKTNLPEACCDVLFSRLVYHHLSDAAAINADIYRALRPGGRYLVIEFGPGGIMDWIGEPRGYRSVHGTPNETVVREVTAAGFRLARRPESWRGRVYAVLFARP